MLRRPVAEQIRGDGRRPTPRDAVLPGWARARTREARDSGFWRVVLWRAVSRGSAASRWASLLRCVLGLGTASCRLLQF